MIGVVPAAKHVAVMRDGRAFFAPWASWVRACAVGWEDALSTSLYSIVLQRGVDQTGHPSALRRLNDAPSDDEIAVMRDAILDRCANALLVMDRDDPLLLDRTAEACVPIGAAGERYVSVLARSIEMEGSGAIRLHATSDVIPMQRCLVRVDSVQRDGVDVSFTVGGTTDASRHWRRLDRLVIGVQDASSSHTGALRIGTEIAIVGLTSHAIAGDRSIVEEPDPRRWGVRVAHSHVDFPHDDSVVTVVDAPPSRSAPQ